MSNLLDELKRKRNCARSQLNKGLSEESNRWKDGRCFGLDEAIKIVEKYEDIELTKDQQALYNYLL